MRRHLRTVIWRQLVYSGSRVVGGWSQSERSVVLGLSFWSILIQLNSVNHWSFTVSFLCLSYLSSSSPVGSPQVSKPRRTIIAMLTLNFYSGHTVHSGFLYKKSWMPRFKRLSSLVVLQFNMLNCIHRMHHSPPYQRSVELLKKYPFKLASFHTHFFLVSHNNRCLK